jgi:hypothetical protein
VVVGLEATGSMQWFLELLNELGIQYRVGHPAKIRAAEPRKQKHTGTSVAIGIKARGGNIVFDGTMNQDGTKISDTTTSSATLAAVLVETGFACFLRDEQGTYSFP